MIELRSARAAATIDLDGGKISSLVVDDLELLVTDGAKSSRWGSFPMAPWAGRLAHGRLDFEGETHTFPITSPPHANHGVAMHQRWTEVAPGTIAIDLPEPWPFGGRVEQRFELADESLTVWMDVRAGDRPMPAQIGWHPWYRRQLGRGAPLELDFTAERIYETDADQLPTGDLSPVPPGPWDDTFTEVTQTPVLRWPGALTVALTSNLDHWVVFTRPEHAVAIEPQSGAPNDVNRAPDVLGPGEKLSGWMRMSWR